MFIYYWMTLKTFMHYSEHLGGVHVLLCNCVTIYVLLCNTVENVIGGSQDPATEVTYLGLNQPPVFSSELSIQQ